MENRFDTLARGLAGGLSRREALRCLGGFVGGTFLACLGMSNKASAGGNGGGNNACDNRCKAMGRAWKGKGFDFTKCLAECHRCKSSDQVCEDRGRKAFFCCNGKTSCCDDQHCTNTDSDNNNCGRCGHSCGSQFTCQKGKCVPHNTCAATGGCGFVPSCGSTGACNCILTAEGTNQCVSDSSCVTAQKCNSSRDCPAGAVCTDASSTCCPDARCAFLCT
ncbi:MAG TPA: hypothetical protein VG013_06645 [Gemmataceae bacterium]|jgi:hypothetical protein|nr:hypothetical protein [Gemmataceae bacterium]